MELEFKMEPGDMISFNNRRILHARKEFDPSTGERHLQGTYIDLDDFYSRFRSLSNTLNEENKIKK
jgi:gamma-butyrobetaine dioxygenase